MECSASIVSIKKNQFQFASDRCTDTISARCGTELSVLEQEQVGVGVDVSSCASEEASMDQDQEDEVSSGGEPAMLLRAPQNATALVGDRVLLKVTYMGHPEPTVRWTRAVSKQNYNMISKTHSFFIKFCLVNIKLTNRNIRISCLLCSCLQLFIFNTFLDR